MFSLERDRLTKDLAVIPADADRVLRETGVPRFAVLDGWIGPTVFLACLETFVGWWDGLVRRRPANGPQAPDDADRELRELAAALERVDPRSLSDAEGYWPAWIEDLRAV